MPPEGFLRPESFPRLTAEDRLQIERFAHATRIGPIFDVRPRHHGQHDHCCAGCNTYRTKTQAKRCIRQPWDVDLADAA
jgi:hypothetical protein